jgi:hypothetical protein
MTAIDFFTDANLEVKLLSSGTGTTVVVTAPHPYAG